MYTENISTSLIEHSLKNMKTARILPFRFIAAARYAPQWETWIEKAMLRCLDSQPKLEGRTVVVVDVSSSMDWDKVSKKSDMTRLDAACGLAICVREICDDVAIYSFSMECKRIPDRHGFALRDAIATSQMHSGTYLGKAIKSIDSKEKYDRIIVITDEQTHDDIGIPKGRGYMLNVASYKNGIGYGSWTHITGFSEAVLKYIAAYEAL